MALNLIFDQSAELYDRVRPRYVQALFDDVEQYAHLGAGSRALEVGAGTGQATGAMLKTGASITALEPGTQMAGLLRAKYADRQNFTVRETLFEDAEGEGTYDLLYSATAFHWIPEEIGYQKAKGMLKPGGAIALFWNHPAPAPECAQMDRAIQAAFEKHRPGSKATPLTEEAIAKRKLTLLKYGFRDVESRVYHSQRRLSAREHTLLLNTYSDHLALAPDVRAALEADIECAIDEYGGVITLCDTIDLYLGRRPPEDR